LAGTAGADFVFSLVGAAGTVFFFDPFASSFSVPVSSPLSLPILIFGIDGMLNEGALKLGFMALMPLKRLFFLALSSPVSLSPSLPFASSFFGSGGGGGDSLATYTLPSSPDGTSPESSAAIIWLMARSTLPSGSPHSQASQSLPR